MLETVCWLVGWLWFVEACLRAVWLCRSVHITITLRKRIPGTRAGGQIHSDFQSYPLFFLHKVLHLLLNFSCLASGLPTRCCPPPVPLPLTSLRIVCARSQTHSGKANRPEQGSQQSRVCLVLGDCCSTQFDGKSGAMMYVRSAGA